MKFLVDMTCTYLGTAEVEASSEEEAVAIVAKSLNHEGLKGFPDEVKVPFGTFKFEEATADYAYND